MKTRLQRRQRTSAALAALASMAICAVFAVSALGTQQSSQQDDFDRGPAAAGSLWGSVGWLALVLAGEVAALWAIRRWAPNSNETLFGLTTLLMGIGWVFVARIDVGLVDAGLAGGLASDQAIAVVGGFAAIAAVLAGVRFLEWLIRHPGACGLVAAGLLAAGSFAAGGDASAGAYASPRQWLNLGSFLSVQPYGLAKIVVAIAACGLATTAPRWLGSRLAPQRHAVGASVAAIAAWALLLVGGDPASSVIVFAAAWLPLWLDDDDDLVPSDRRGTLRSARAQALSGIAVVYGVGVVVALTVYDRLSAQVIHWLNPWAVAERSGIIDAVFAISAGGVSGVGLGLGAPQMLGESHSSFVFAVVVEELGILGGAALLIAFMLIVGIGAGIAQRAQGVHRLMAAAAASVIGLQAFFSIAGVLRLLPHTVGALPFVAYGPLSIIGNCVAVGVLLAVSDINGRSHQSEPQQLPWGEP